jgi:predicted ATPase/class 3 adenylate cyclase
MSELPSGTVTFLFTDIEGSTTRWEHQPETMQVALARHDALLRAAIGEHDGHVVKTMGDAFLAAFGRAPDALAAAQVGQRLLQAEPWDEIAPEIGPLRVRMALHTGAAEERDGDYFGPPLNRTARLLHTGHGGQVLLSLTTSELVRDTLPEGTSLLDLGEHRLKDLTRPERIFQLADIGLPAEFPPLRSLDDRPHNLPVHPSTLLGRDLDVARVRELLLREDVWLLTLTGPGGSGKTRLSLQVAAEAIDHFEDGVYFVALAPISDPDLVASTIARTLGLRVDSDTPVVETLKQYLEDQQMLLVLDNFEQVLPAAQVVGELLGAAPRLVILVTSRAALQLHDEHEYPVPPLALPDRRAAPRPAALSQYGAVALFVERALAIKPDFTVTNANAPAIAEICHRLDGLPLAIELAAARTRLLTPQAILARLERRLPLLTGGSRDLPARQQTLRNAIAWSYDLLTADEQILFRRLAIFVGGCTLDAAEAVCDPHGTLGLDASASLEQGVLDGAMSLATQSLISQAEAPDAEPRFSMLETIREYGLEQLEASGEAEEIRRAHAACFLALVREIEPRLHGADQRAAFGRLSRELDNLRSILRRCVRGEIDVEVGLHIAGRLNWFWGLRGFAREGRGWIEALLSLPAATARTPARAWALQSASAHAIGQADYAGAEAFARESAEIFWDAGDRQGAARSLAHLGSALTVQGEHAAAKSALEESVETARAVRDRWGLAFALYTLGATLRNTGERTEERSRYEESSAIAREIGDLHTLGLSLAGLAYFARTEGDNVASSSFWRQALTTGRDFDDHWLLPRAVAGLAGAALLAGQHDRAAVLFGIADALREANGTREVATWKAVVDADVAATRAALGDEAYAAARLRGRAMAREQALAYALDAPVPA